MHFLFQGEFPNNIQTQPFFKVLKYTFFRIEKLNFYDINFVILYSSHVSCKRLVTQTAEFKMAQTHHNTAKKTLKVAQNIESVYSESVFAPFFFSVLDIKMFETFKNVMTIVLGLYELWKNFGML